METNLSFALLSLTTFFDAKSSILYVSFKRTKQLSLGIDIKKLVRALCPFFGSFFTYLPRFLETRFHKTFRDSKVPPQLRDNLMEKTPTSFPEPFSWLGGGARERG